VVTATRDRGAFWSALATPGIMLEARSLTLSTNHLVTADALDRSQLQSAAKSFQRDQPIAVVK
jgi:hypothetical protein